MEEQGSASVVAGLEASDLPVARVDRSSTIVSMNVAFQRLIPQAKIGVDAHEVLAAPDLCAAVAKASAGTPASAAAGGDLEGAVVQCFPASQPGDGAVLLISGAPSSRANSNLRLLQNIASALASTLTSEEVSAAVLGTVGDAVAAVSSSIWLVDREGQNLLLADAKGNEAGALKPYTKMPLGAELPGPVVVRTGEPIFLSSRIERDTQWPVLVGTPTKSEALAVVPLRVHGNRIGVLAFGFPEVHAFDADDRMTLMAIGDQCAAALDRARLHDQLRADAARKEIIARVTSALAGNLEPASVIDEVTKRSVPDLADICCVYVREGDLVARVAMSSTIEQAEELRERYLLPLDAPLPVCEAIRTGEAQRFARIDPADLAAGAPDDRYVEIINALPLNDGIVVPLFQGGVPFGAMTFVFSTPSRTYDAPFREVVDAVADRTAAALDGARRFQDQHAAVVALHDVALPSAPPAVEGLEIAAVYVPFTSETGLGGDWWDVFPLRGKSVAMAVGDVAGHGVNTAAVMGQLRNALRAFMIRGSGTRDALDAVSDLLAWEHGNTFATAVVGQFHVDSLTFEWSSAGHPPPLVVHPDGTAEFLQTASRPPLGASGGSSALRGTATTLDVFSRQLAPGTVIYLFTDGLVERKGRDLDTGMELLGRVVSEIEADTDLQSHCERVVASLVDEVDDDVCLLAVRIADRTA